MHTILFRRYKPEYRFRILRNLFLIFLMIFVAAVAYLSQGIANSPNESDDSVLYYVASLGVAWFLYMGFLQFFFFLDRSISFQINTDIARSPTADLSFNDLLVKYQKIMSVPNRLESLKRNGYIIQTDGLYAVASKGRFLANFTTLFRRLLKLDEGETP